MGPDEDPANYARPAQPQIIEEWDGENPPDYVSPVKPGTRYQISRSGTFFIAKCVRTEGFFPGVAEFEHGVRIDLVGWTVEEMPAPQPAGTLAERIRKLDITSEEAQYDNSEIAGFHKGIEAAARLAESEPAAVPAEGERPASENWWGKNNLLDRINLWRAGNRRFPGDEFTLLTAAATEVSRLTAALAEARAEGTKYKQVADAVQSPADSLAALTNRGYDIIHRGLTHTEVRHGGSGAGAGGAGQAR